jgi:hypothetical protein
MSAAPDPARCPLCGQPNRCAMEMAREPGAAASPCWCTQAEFASDLLARVPPAVRGRACICAACAAASRSAVEPRER